MNTKLDDTRKENLLYMSPGKFTLAFIGPFIAYCSAEQIETCEIFGEHVSDKTIKQVNINAVRNLKFC